MDQPAASALHIDTTYLQVWGLGILLLGWRGRCPGPWCTPRNLGSPERTYNLRWLEFRTHLCTDCVTSMVPVVLSATMFTSSKDPRKRRVYSPYNKAQIIKRSQRLEYLLLTCSTHLWTSQWEDQKSKAPARLPICSSGSWPSCCKPIRAGTTSGAER